MNYHRALVPRLVIKPRIKARAWRNSLTTGAYKLARVQRAVCTRPKVKEKKVHAGTGRWALTSTQYTTLHSTAALYTFLFIVFQFTTFFDSVASV